MNTYVTNAKPIKGLEEVLYIANDFRTDETMLVDPKALTLINSITYKGSPVYVVNNERAPEPFPTTINETIQPYTVKDSPVNKEPWNRAYVRRSRRW